MADKAQKHADRELDKQALASHREAAKEVVVRKGRMVSGRKNMRLHERGGKR